MECIEKKPTAESARKKRKVDVHVELHPLSIVDFIAECCEEYWFIYGILQYQMEMKAVHPLKPWFFFRTSFAHFEFVFCTFWIFSICILIFKISDFHSPLCFFTFWIFILCILIFKISDFHFLPLCLHNLNSIFVHLNFKILDFHLPCVLHILIFIFVHFKISDFHSYLCVLHILIFIFMHFIFL